MDKKVLSVRIYEDKIKQIDYICDNENIDRVAFISNAIEDYFYKIVAERSKDESKKTNDLEFIKSLNTEKIEEAVKGFEDVALKLNNLVEKKAISDEDFKSIVEILKGGER